MMAAWWCQADNEVAKKKNLNTDKRLCKCEGLKETTEQGVNNRFFHDNFYQHP
jgi:hypothetical protein